MSIIAYKEIERFRAFEALLETYRESMTRERARERGALWNIGAERRAAAESWFDLRWPEAHA